MSYRDIRDAREGFVDMDMGDKIIHIESIIMGIAGFIVGIAFLDLGLVVSLIVGGMVAFVFPWLVGLFTIFAWIATIFFSLVWAVVGYFIGGALLGNSVIAGVLVAIIVFISSFFAHKVFAGLGFSSLTSHVINSVDEIASNTRK